MKLAMIFYVVNVLALCLCLGQLCSGGSIQRLRNEPNDVREDDDARMRDFMKIDIREKIIGVSERFVDDYAEIQLKDEISIIGYPKDLINLLIGAGASDSKIDVNKIKELQSYIYPSAWTAPQKASMSAFLVDHLKLAQSIWSKQMPAERFNGIINLAYVLNYSNATEDETESALNYLYGVDTEARKTSFIDAHNFPELSKNDCRGYSEIDALKTLVGLKPKVKQDFDAIMEKFPCSYYTNPLFEFFIYAIKQWHGDESKINACMMKENPVAWGKMWYSDLSTSTQDKETALQKRERILAARLPDETFHGILNFVRATIADTPIDQIEKALEYLYDEVPKSECTESTTLKNE